MSINDDVESIYRHINLMLREAMFSEIGTVHDARPSNRPKQSKLTRINEGQESMLYLTILTTQQVVLRSHNSPRSSSTC